jgi:hypothetical protein
VGIYRRCHAVHYRLSKWKPFAKAKDKELAKEDRTFVSRIMRMDPRDRPTAKELLRDPWLRGV